MSLITSFYKSKEKKTSQVLTEDVRTTIPNFTEREAASVKDSLQQNESRKRGKYHKWTVEEKKEVGEYAVRHGPAKTVRALQTKYPGLTKQSVHDFKKVF